MGQVCPQLEGSVAGGEPSPVLVLPLLGVPLPTCSRSWVLGSRSGTEGWRSGGLKGPWRRVRGGEGAQCTRGVGLG